jgi:hypothetical protein
MFHGAAAKTSFLNRKENRRARRVRSLKSFEIIPLPGLRTLNPFCHAVDSFCRTAGSCGAKKVNLSKILKNEKVANLKKCRF